MELVNSIGQVQFNRHFIINEFDHIEKVNLKSGMQSGVYILNIYDGSDNRLKTLGLL